MARTLVALALAVSQAWVPCAAQEIEVEKTTEEPWRVWLPFAFTGERYGLAVGLGGGMEGLIAPGVVSLGAGYVTTNGTAALMGYGGRIPVGLGRRVLLEPVFSAGRYTEMQGYFNGNPLFPDEDSGSNDSSAENFIDAPGWDLWSELKVIVPLNDPDRLRPEAIHWLARCTAFYRLQTFTLDEGTLRLPSSGLAFSLTRDARDSILDPYRGNLQAFKVTRDFGWAGDADPWTKVELDARAFVPLGRSDGWFRQHVLALDLWTANVPTWSAAETPGGPGFSSAPPYYEAPSLGGFHRLRAFPVNRFNDRAALYLAAEFRGRMRGSPLQRVPFMPGIEFGWWQLVTFVEVGRVAPEWDLSTLVSDLKWDVGVGVRALTNGVLLRADVAVADEGWSLRVLAGHAF